MNETDNSSLANEATEKIGPVADIGSLPEEELYERLITDLTLLQFDAEISWRRIRDHLGSISPDNITSARNLIHYLALRRTDIRDLQNALARNGISSLGRSESHVMSNLNKVLKLLHRIVDHSYEPLDGCEQALSLDEGAEIIAKRSTALLGPPPNHRKVRIMVTLPTEAAANYTLVRDLIAGGMDCARINCAHDNPDVWARTIENIEKARTELGRNCKICMDIAGPKLRTGPFEPGPQVLKWRPEHDVFGHVTAPVRIWMTRRESPENPSDTSTHQIALPAEFVNRLKPGDKINFNDARGTHRRLHVTSVNEQGVWLETKKTAYIGPNTRFTILGTELDEVPVRAVAGPLPSLEQHALLHVADDLILTRSQVPGRPAAIGKDGAVLQPARVSCTLPEVFDYVKPGEKIWFDDGQLGGVIVSVKEDEIAVKITRAGPKGHKLRADKGINLPESKLSLPALTAKDLAILEFIVRHADIVGYSFVHSADDVRMLHEQLKKMTDRKLGIIFKIETRAAFDNLPEILFGAMETEAIGVMIARGDLAVECGFKRMAEIQEEILWMCEAAHLPVIWATQVLEQLCKEGIYSRAEITDAAMSERAECVMLNKGPYVLEAVQTLDDVLRRMQSHQEKKRSMMRPLKLAERFFAKADGTTGRIE